MRDDLAGRLAEVREQAAAQAERQAEARLLIERMLLDPAPYRWVRVANEDIGETGCKHWHVRPRLGLIGMLAGWWHVRSPPAAREPLTARSHLMGRRSRARRAAQPPPEAPTARAARGPRA